MEFICHKSFQGLGATEKKYNIKKGTKLDEVNGWILKGKEAICHAESETAHRHFARNDDGRGQERGELTNKIAYALRKPNKNDAFRFTPEEVELLEKEYSHWLVSTSITILFNDSFFRAEIEELEELLNRLEA